VFHVKFVRTNPNFDSKVKAPRLTNGIDNQTKVIGTRGGSAKWVFFSPLTAVVWKDNVIEG
jgi:hypothetical protein